MRVKNQLYGNTAWKPMGGEKVGFTVKLIRKHKTAFGRQTHEIVAISTSVCDYTLNKKDDWNSSRLPRLIVEVRGELVEEGGRKGPRKGELPSKNPLKARLKR